MRLAVLVVLGGCQVINEPDTSFLDDPPPDACDVADPGTCDDTTHLRTCTDEGIPNVIDCGTQCVEGELGTCVSTGDDASCDCESECEQQGIDCGGHGDCIARGDGFGCQCEVGFVEVEGPNCEPAPPVEACDVDGDEDLDGFADCADFDCVGASRCCGGGPELPPAIDVNFGSDGVSSANWEHFADRADPPDERHSLEQFGDFPEGSGLFWNEPVDFSGGLDVTMVGSSDAGAVCDGVAGCPDWVGIAFTRVRTFVAGVPLPTSLAVYVAPNGRVIVVRGGVVRQRGFVDTGGFRIGVRLTPASLAGVSGFAVEVLGYDFVNPLLAPVTIYASQGPLLAPEDDLLIDGTQGAKFAVIGRNSTPSGTVTLDAVLAVPRACANPSVWTALDSVGPADIGLGAADWALGSIGAPSAATIDDAGQDVRLLFDASNLDPFFEIYGDVHKSVGELVFDSTRILPLEKFGDAVAAPVIGQNPPNCIEEPCPSPDASEPIDARRPGVFRAPVLGMAAWVVEDDGGELRMRTWGGGAWSAYAGGAAFWAAPDWGFEEFTGAAGVVRGTDTCVFVVGHAAAQPGELWAACESDIDTLLSSFAPVPVLVPDLLGSIASGGIETASVVFDPGADGEADDLFRIWAVVEDGAGRSTIAHAVAGASLDAALVQPYSGNPVLRADSEFLGGCAGECQFSGVSVVEFAAERQFFVGRQEDADSTTFEIFALSQGRGGI